MRGEGIGSYSPGIYFSPDPTQHFLPALLSAFSLLLHRPLLRRQRGRRRRVHALAIAYMSGMVQAGWLSIVAAHPVVVVRRLRQLLVQL